MYNSKQRVEGMIIPAGSSRQATQPPFWRIFQLDRAVGPPSPCSNASVKNDEVGIPVKKSRKPPNLPAPILANFSARSGRPASQPLFDAAGKYDEVGIPVEKKTPKKAECTRWQVVPPGPGTAHHPRRLGGTFV